MLPEKYLQQTIFSKASLALGSGLSSDNLVSPSQPVWGRPNLLERLLVESLGSLTWFRYSEGFSNSAGGEDFGC